MIINMTVTVHINVSTPEGRKLVHDLEKHRSIVVIDQPVDIEKDVTPQKTYSADYAENLLWEKLNEHYGEDIHDL